jgi:hypothetical protein
LRTLKTTRFPGQDARCTHKTSFAGPPDSSGRCPETLENTGQRVTTDVITPAS